MVQPIGTVPHFYIREPFHQKGTPVLAAKLDKETASVSTNMKKDIHIEGLVKRGATWWVRKMTNGRLIQKSTGSKDQQEAFRRMAELIGSPELRYSCGKHSFEYLIPRYTQFKVQTGCFSRFSEKEKPGILWRFADAVGRTRDIKDITEKKIIETLTSGTFENIKPVTRNTYLRAVKSFFTWAHKMEKITLTNLARDIPPFKEQQESIKRMQEKEVILVAEEIDFVLRAAFLRKDWELFYVLVMGFGHGLRRNEIAESRATWFDFERGVLTIDFLEKPEAKTTGLDEFYPKWNKSRDIPISPQHRLFLQDFVAGKDYCLASAKRRGKGRYRHDYHKKYSNFMRYLEMSHMTIHGMRRSYASNLAREGKPISEIAANLGDGIRVTEKHYLHHQPHHKDFAYIYGDDLATAKIEKLKVLWDRIKANQYVNPHKLEMPFLQLPMATSLTAQGAL